MGHGEGQPPLFLVPASIFFGPCNTEVLLPHILQDPRFKLPIHQVPETSLHLREALTAAYHSTFLVP